MTGRCGDRLADLFGVSKFRYVRRFDRINLSDQFPGKAGKGDEIGGRVRAMDITIQLALFPRPFAILLGNHVARAFGKEDRIFRGFSLHGTPAWVLPHPSGINLWWNDPRNVARARRFCRRLATTHLPPAGQSTEEK